MTSAIARRLWRWSRDQCARIVISRPGLTRAIVRRAGSPSLFELSESARSWHTSATHLLAELPIVSGEWDSLTRAAEAAVQSICERSEELSLEYPAHFAVERQTAALLYVAVRITCPKIVVETGVADGLSSAVILEALAANGEGELHSIDIAKSVGSLIRDKAAWHLHVVSEDTLGEDLDCIAKAVPPIDLFLHDANHDYHHQMLEYKTFWRVMRPGGLFLSDDIDLSYAFLDFVQEVDRVPAMLLDSRKVIGVITR